jgi:hypothetical protein
MPDILWFVNGNFKVRADSEVEAIQRLADALSAAKLVAPDEGMIEGWNLTHATQEGEGG